MVTGKSYDGMRSDGYVQQGVDWKKFEIAKTTWTLETFAGLRFAQNTYHDDYGNHVGPWVGVQIKHDFSPPFGSTGYGQIAIGVRGESNYHPNHLGNELLGVAYFQWSAGGNLKKQQ